jgi:hypothetical protein
MAFAPLALKCHYNRKCGVVSKSPLISGKMKKLDFSVSEIN